MRHSVLFFHRRDLLFQRVPVFVVTQKNRTISIIVEANHLHIFFIQLLPFFVLKYNNSLKLMYKNTTTLEISYHTFVGSQSLSWKKITKYLSFQKKQCFL